MPARRKVARACLIVAYFDTELHDKLKELARERGVSTSELLREIVAEYLSRAGKEPRREAAASPQAEDPLLQLEVEEFERKLSRLERDVAALEQQLSAALKRGTGHLLATSINLSSLRSRAWDLVDTWHSLRKFYSRIPRTTQRSARLAAVKRKLNTLLDATEPKR